MRTGDFSEVLAFNSTFRIYDPATGNPTTGADRTVFPNAQIPANRIDPIAAEGAVHLPAAQRAGHQQRHPEQLRADRVPGSDRDNVDFKINWNRTSSNQIWGKYSRMDASVLDLFYLPVHEAGGGDTTVNLWSVGQTWTLSPTLIWDATVGLQRHGPRIAGSGLRHQLRSRHVRHPRHQRRRRHGSRLAGRVRGLLLRLPAVQHRSLHASATTTAGRR